MLKNVFVASSALACVFAASTASAGDLFNLDPAPSGVYAAVYGGRPFLNDSAFSGVSTPEAGVPGPTGAAGVPLNADLELSGDFTVGAALGYQLPFRYFSIFHPRLEVEVSYLEQNVEGGSFNGGAQIFGGEQEQTFVFFNNYSDIIFSENQRFTPYVGGGIGVAFVDSNAVYFPPTAAGPTFGIVGEDSALAGHFAVGGTFDVSDNVEFYTEGRYFRIQNVDLERRFIGGGADLLSGAVEDDIEGFTATAGLRYRF